MMPSGSNASPQTEPTALQGRLDEAGPDQVAGWAMDGPSPVRIRIIVNGAVIGVAVADQYRPDLAAAGIGRGHHGFRLVLPGPLSPTLRHTVIACRDSDGQPIDNSPVVVEPTETANRGSLDVATRTRVAGWSIDDAEPDGAAPIEILDNGAVIARAVANAYRPDLLAAGIGRGWHGFDVDLPAPLSLHERHVVAVRRIDTGAELPGSPQTIEAARDFDPALEQAVARAIDALESEADQARMLGFLAEQADRLRQLRADADGQRRERQSSRAARRRLGPGVAVADPPRRALVIDEQAPDPGRDAGSQAVMSHMRALQRLGYAVSFAASHGGQPPSPALAAAGVTWCGAPFYTSIEEVLRRQGDCFDVVYLHRVTVATRYLALARAYMPRARILYSVADLHHLRLERQAAIEERPELLGESRRLRLQECTAAWSADAVVTHSLTEQALLRQAVPTADVHHVGWHTPLRKPAPFADRHGVAFIGQYAHAPNVDAAEWLVEAVAPLAQAVDPGIGFLLVGAGMTARVLRLARPGVVVIGAVADLGPAVFDRVRLTVAPLRFGAGLKGKVLESLAAGLPCAMTPIAMEGLPDQQHLAAMLGTDAAGLAAVILRLHGDAQANRAAAKAGQALLAGAFSEDGVAAGLLGAIEGRRQPGQSAIVSG